MKPISVQLYSLREECEKDFIGTLEKTASLGFDGVEFAGYYGMEPADLRKELDRLNLRASGSHFPLKPLEENFEEYLEAQKVLGSRYLIVAYPLDRMDREEEYRELAAKLNKIGERCREEGITLCYHNHDFELQEFNHKTGFDILLEETEKENLAAEPDIYWMTYADKDPVSWIKTYKGRTPLVHLKDMTNDSERAFAPLGEGRINLKPVLALEEEAGVEWWIIEQDEAKEPPLECIKRSLQFLKQQAN
ncbi:sugar phosphate isomerase/epimerase [Metabacillus sp. GX 13764]|uniref:sugar phosphate isomerase/epimerase family protein n=1 Tax=Metabacillus kandeliae TaxID=2900151 RepID=UPI001E4D7E5E|nr:sugar phosphate isomerase/epimerase [Metabacillus kandeliae]MCD7035836.1 sugar phosphate isomerase/epimerase [Metabacillus kandeliae]